MSNQISINILYGRGVDESDKSRARDAAYAVIESVGTTVDEAFAEFKRQWEWLGSEAAAADGKGQDYENMTGLAAVWVRAERAADIALTAGWANPRSASCGISA